MENPAPKKPSLLKMDLRQSPAYAKHLSLHSWRVEKVKNDFVFIRRLPLTNWSIIKYQRPEKLSLKKIGSLARKSRALKIYIEPRTKQQVRELLKNGYHLSTSPFLPSKTLHLNLQLSLDKLTQKLRKSTRYEIKQARKKDLQIKNTSPKKFRLAWKKSVGWKKYVPSLKKLESLKKSFGQKALFLVVENDQNQILAGAIFLTAAKTAYYYYAFTNKKGRQTHAQALLVWEGVRQLKKAGCHQLDLEGIFDKRFPINSWQGFSYFKKGFGGQEVFYPGCFVKNRLFYRPKLHKSSCTRKSDS